MIATRNGWDPLPLDADAARACGPRLRPASMPP